MKCMTPSLHILSFPPVLTRDRITIANMFFMPAVYGYDAASRSQAISFLSDGGIIIAVWCLESMRKGEKPWYLQQ